MGELSDHDALYWQSGPSPQDVEKARLLLERRAAFRELVDGALATLRAEGLSVERVSAASLMAVQIMIAAAQLGVTPATAITYATPDGLVKALRSVAGDPHAHAIRPTGFPDSAAFRWRWPDSWWPGSPSARSSPRPTATHGSPTMRPTC